MKEYKIFASFKQRLLIDSLLFFGILFSVGLNFLISSPSFIILVAAEMAVLIMVFLDYFIFGGIAVKNQKIMECVKSSYYGPEFINKAISEEVIITYIKLFAFTVLAMVFMCITLTKEVSAVSIVFSLAIAFTAICLLSLSKMITRKFARTLVAQMGFSYLFSFAGSFLFLPAFYLFFGNEINVINVIFTVFMFALSILLSVFLKVECVKGFISDYMDKQ